MGVPGEYLRTLDEKPFATKGTYNAEEPLLFLGVERAEQHGNVPMYNIEVEEVYTYDSEDDGCKELV